MDLLGAETHQGGVIGLWIDIESPAKITDGSFPFDVLAINFVMEEGNLAG
jgi:hypothetical protein